MCRQIIPKSSNMQMNETLSSGRRVFPCRHTERLTWRKQ